MLVVNKCKGHALVEVLHSRDLMYDKGVFVELWLLKRFAKRDISGEPLDEMLALAVGLN